MLIYSSSASGTSFGSLDCDESWRQSSSANNWHDFRVTWTYAVLKSWAHAGALLEKQVVMFCPNIGLLSTCVLSLIPLLRPFSWHSFLMPVLPDKLLGFLEAPVPFIIGVQVSHTFFHIAILIPSRFRIQYG